MASFAHIDQTPFTERERSLIRVGLNLVMAWHVVWAANNSFGRISPEMLAGAAQVYAHASWLARTGFALGLIGLALQAHRTRRLPSIRVLTPWIALHVWYLAMASDFSALLVAQLGHSLQYLVFPLRLEMNREPTDSTRGWLKPIASLATWTIIGIAVFEGAEPVFNAGYYLGGGTGQFPAVMSTALITCIGIHHYFIDGALYKLRNPEVRRALFAHLPRR